MRCGKMEVMETEQTYDNVQHDCQLDVADGGDAGGPRIQYGIGWGRLHIQYQLFVFFLILLLLAQPGWAQKKKDATAKPLSGLYLTVDAGLLMPNGKQADFYSGKDGYPNKLKRVLKSELYGNQIWSSLVDQGLISPSAIQSYREFEVAEFPTMYYRLTYQLGVGFRYVYSNGWGWFARFDFSELTAAGQFMLSSNNGTGILGGHQYVPCDIYGLEKRVMIDFAITKRIPLSQMLDLEVDAGVDINNTKVVENGMRIGGKNYSILDVWDGQSPYAGIGTYEYINQGAIGLGGFGAIALSYRVPMGAFDFGYQYYYMQTKFRDFNEEDCYAPQHTIFLRFNMNNFSFFGK